MRLCQNSKLFALTISFLPSTVSARRGDGGSDGGGGDFGVGSTSGLGLEAFDAAIFAFCVIFAILTTFQAIQATINVLRRIAKHPPSIALPEFSLGHIFPTFLLLTTLILTIVYVLHGVHHALVFNQNTDDFPSFTGGYFHAWVILAFFQEIFLVAGLLALISHRNKVLFSSSGASHKLKIAVDTTLIVILLALGMGHIGSEATAKPRLLSPDLLPNASDGGFVDTPFNLYVAYTVFFLITILDIAISSIILNIHCGRSPTKDHKIASRIAFIISPLLIIYAIFYIVQEGVNHDSYQEPDIIPPGWSLAGLVINGIAEFIVIATCLKFGFPTRERPTEKNDSSLPGAQNSA